LGGDANGASQVIERMRDLANKSSLTNDLAESKRNGGRDNLLDAPGSQTKPYSLKTQVSKDIPLILADRIQLQQVFLDLIINTTGALSAISSGPRGLLVATRRDNRMAPSCLSAVRAGG
jgi:phosphoglycerate-specific signal transduction histidine kinase